MHSRPYSRLLSPAHKRGLCRLDGKCVLQVVRLKMQMVDRGVGTQRIVAHPEEREECLRVELLWEPLRHPRQQEDVTVVNGRNVNADQIRSSLHVAAPKVHDQGTAIAGALGLESKQHLVHAGLRKVKLLVVKRLAHLIHAELGSALLLSPSDVELGDVRMPALHQLAWTGRDVITEEASGEGVIPAICQDFIQ
eukprot:scaffold1018_cov420-Prasinococcus_capsulatus_cf.AAC.4